VSHFLDTRTFQVLAQQHYKRGRIQHQFARFAFEKVNPRELRMGGGDEPAGSSGTTVELERYRLRRWLDDSIDARADQCLAELIGNRVQCQSVDMHGGIASFPAR
jgi:hypothetical protein